MVAYGKSEFLWIVEAVLPIELMCLRVRIFDREEDVEDYCKGIIARGGRVRKWKYGFVSYSEGNKEFIDE